MTQPRSPRLCEFGDRRVKRQRARELRRIRLVGVVLLAATAWYVPWMLHAMRPGLGWIAFPFVAANFVVLCAALVSLVNNWKRAVPPERLVARGTEPLVAVVVPTCAEPVGMVERTVRSVLVQDWPENRLVVIVSDDANNVAVAEMVDRLQSAFPRTTVRYHRPPPRESAQRRGDAKDGNLNAALALLDSQHPDVAWIETRDADDELGDPRFLRHCIGQMEAEPRVAFVQTIKDARVAEGDPFDNRALYFYRGTMLARQAANAVFPCGSGVVWRRFALNDIGGFPTWNLVEDVQSGVEALRRGWRGVYLPIVGALAQSAPEDLPNVYKQRGTWALDSMRLMLWAELRGLTLRQRLQFLEIQLQYMQGMAVVVFMFLPVFSFLFGLSPLRATPLSYATHLLPFIVALECYYWVYQSGGDSFRRYVRARELTAGLSPLFLKAAVLAVLAGPHHKPAYRVTRKVPQFALYGREIVVQLAMVMLVVLAIGYRVMAGGLYDVGSLYWAMFWIALIIGFIPRAWFGVDLGSTLSNRVGSSVSDLRHTGTFLRLRHLDFAAAELHAAELIERLDRDALASAAAGSRTRHLPTARVTGVDHH